MLNPIILSLKNISIGYHQNREECILLKNLSLYTEIGKLICIIGRNGIGKSTLIRTISGIQKPLSGEIFIDGNNIHLIDAKFLASKLSIVYTDTIDVENLSVYDLIAMGRYPYLSWLGILSTEDESIIQKSISVTGINHIKNKNVLNLSDGEKQKIMIARAIVQDTPIMLLDEPTSHLDIAGRLDVFIMLKKLCQQENKTILLSTHQLDCALQFSDEIWLLTSEQELISGSPNDAVLTSCIGKEFNSQHLHFDKGSGIFKYNPHL